jgi:predicted Zn-dependent protease
MMSMMGVKVDKDTQDKAKLAAAVADLFLEMTKDSPLTPVEERILGYECLAHCIGKDTVLPPTNPISIYVNWMGTKIAANSSMPYPSIGYTFVVVQDDNTINAMAMPGGPIIITTGMLKFLESESELATILGHEIAHVEERHGMKAAENAGAKKLAKLLDFAQMQASGKSDKFLNDALASALKDLPEAIRKEAVSQVKKLLNEALEKVYAEVMLKTSESISKGSSQAGECAADLRGMSLARAAGWNPVALDSVLARLKATKGDYGGASYCDLRAQQATEVGTLLPPSTADAPAVAANWKTLDGDLKK